MFAKLLYQLARHFFVLALISFVGSVHAFASGMMAVTAGQDRRHHVEEILVSYTEAPNLSGEVDGGASINIYRDGYAHIFFPEYMQHAGNYGVYLDRQILDQIWALLVNTNILAFDAQGVRHDIFLEKQIRKKTSSILSNVSDASKIVFEIYPNRYRPIGFGNGDSNESKEITWSGLRWDATHYPEIEMIQSLAALQKIFLSILAQSDLEKLD